MVRSWTTEKGTKIEIETSQDKTVTINADGDQIETTQKGMMVEKITVNGKEGKYPEYFWHCQLQKNCVKAGFDGIGKATIVLPEKIDNEITAIDRAREEKRDSEMKEYYRQKAIIDKAMSY